MAEKDPRRFGAKTNLVSGAEAEAAGVAGDFIVARGEVVSGPRGKRVVARVGESFAPADDEECDRLLAQGNIVPAEEFFARAGGEPAQAAIGSLRDRAEAAEAEVRRLRGGRHQREAEPLKPAS